MINSTGFSFNPDILECLSEAVFIFDARLAPVFINKNGQLFLSRFDIKEEDFRHDSPSNPLIREFQSILHRVRDTRKTSIHTLKESQNKEECHGVPTLNNGEIKSITLICKTPAQKAISQKDFLEHVIESITIPFYLIDPNSYKVTMANQAAKALSDPASTHCYEMTHKFDRPCHEKGDEHPCPIEILKKTKAPITMEHIHPAPDGEKRYYEVHAYPVFSEDKEITAVIETSIDITYRKLASFELEKLTVNLQNSNDKLKHFVYAASHDLKEPIRMINSYLGLIKKQLESDSPDKDSLDDFMEFAMDGATRMNQLIDDLLNYSRLETRKAEFEELSLDEPLQTAISNLDTYIRENNAAIQLEGLPRIKGLRIQLVQLFQNLISNAVKYHQDGVAPLIKIYSDKTAEYQKIYIEDNGIGIAEKFQQKIFDIFVRLHTREKYEGTGVGLAVCRKVMENHYGYIDIESDEESGTTFILNFPRKTPVETG